MLVSLVADLVPAGLLGRYQAVMGFSWWIGLTLAPTIGVLLLSLSPAAAFLAAAGVVTGRPRLSPHAVLPGDIRLTPRPQAATQPSQVPACPAVVTLAIPDAARSAASPAG